MRVARSLAVSVCGFVSILAASAAHASPAAYACDRSVSEADQAKSIVLAKAKSVTSARKDARWVVRVTYAIDQSLVGSKTGDIVVEESCTLAPVTAQEVGYPGFADHCTSVGTHRLPGLTADGKAGGTTAALLLSDATSAMDGKPVQRLVRASVWAACADDAELVNKRPALKDLAAKVKAANAQATFGFVDPPADAWAAVAGSSAPSATIPPSAASSSAPPASTVPAPRTSSGCSLASTTRASSLSGVWLALGVLLASVARRAVAARAA